MIDDFIFKPGDLIAAREVNGNIRKLSPWFVVIETRPVVVPGVGLIATTSGYRLLCGRRGIVVVWGSRWVEERYEKF